MNQPLKSCFTFGELLLDVAERRLMRNGAVVPLAPKVFDTLLLFVENPAHLLEKDELMKRLWQDTFVGEDTLARNISTLRKALGESSESQAYIATVPKRGYRFVATVQRLTEPAGSRAELQEPPQASVTGLAIPPENSSVSEAGSQGPWRRRIALIALTLGTGSLAGLVTFYLLAPLPEPRILRSTRLTHSGRVDPWGGIVRDGSRLYYIEREGDHWNLLQTSTAGGGSQDVAAPFRNTVVLDVSPDRAKLLIGTFASRGALKPLWIWPVQGGALQRVGEIAARSAAWCPNGREIVYGEDDGLYLANADGTNARKFVTTEGEADRTTWSPDGRTLRFTLKQVSGFTIWEVRSDGSQLHRLLPTWDDKPEEEYDGAWTGDGKYFVFESRHSGTMDLWAVRGGRTLLRSQPLEPTRLTNGPMSYGSPVSSDDGRQLFVVGASGGGELARYDVKSHQPRSLLPGICQYTLLFSADGVYVACTSPDGSLVRMKPDGSERLVVTSLPLTRYSGNPRWSPDGKQIVFEGTTTSGGRRLFLVSSDGGTPRELFPDVHNQGDPSWSPDGRLIAFSSEENSAASGSPSFTIQVLDLSTNRLSLLPGSLGMRSPAWSPDGRFIAAVTENLDKLMLFDLQTRQWTPLAQATLLNGQLAWAKDGNSLYYQDLLAANEPVYSLRLSDRKREVMESFESLLRGGVQRVFFVGLAPDNSLVLSLDRNTADIYALEVDFP
ncbi:MAG: winged helix-turn-helix domain-containing protein [Candidatus Sulfotelmatobacter sp.]